MFERSANPGADDVDSVELLFPAADVDIPNEDVPVIADTKIEASASGPSPIPVSRRDGIPLPVGAKMSQSRAWCHKAWISNIVIASELEWFDAKKDDRLIAAPRRMSGSACKRRERRPPINALGFLVVPNPVSIEWLDTVETTVDVEGGEKTPTISDEIVVSNFSPKSDTLDVFKNVSLDKNNVWMHPTAASVTGDTASTSI